MKIIVSGGQFFADGFALRRAFTLEEGESRFISYLWARGCGCARLRLLGGRLTVTEGAIGLVQWKKGAELFPLPLAPASPERREKEFTVESERFRVMCLCGNPSEIRFSGAIEGRHEASTAFFNPTISLLGGQHEAILDIHAVTAEGDYLALFAVRKGAFRLLLEESGESISCIGNEVTVTKSLADLCSRRIVSRYLWRGEAFSCSREITCAKEHSFIREEMGRSLLEAVLAGDRDGIAGLLSPEIANADAILDYFGEIIAVRPALFEESRTAVAALRKRGNDLFATVYDFDFDGRGRISNIRCLDES